MDTSSTPIKTSSPTRENAGMEENIFAQVRKEITDFIYSFIFPVPGYSFNQYRTIKRCHLYHNSKFEDATTYLGRDKIFFNVVNPACEVASKMLNVDSKNIRLWPLSPKSYFSTYLLEKELKEWLKTSKMSRVLNQLAEELPQFGSVVLEKTSKGAKIVDIRYLVNDQSVEHIADSRFIETVHYMTPSELRASGWDENAVEQAIARCGSSDAAPSYIDFYGNYNLQNSSPYIKVVKRYGEVPEKWLPKGNKNSNRLVKSLFIVAGADMQEYNVDGKAIGEKGVVLFASPWRKPWPFKDFHYTKVKGRWLGVGVIEMLFDVQMRVNEMKNQKRVAMEISSMHLFQSQDKTVVRNVLTDLEPGDLVLSKNGIEPIANEERNLSAFKDEEESYGQQVDKLTFAYEALRGETAPSSTPLGTTQIATAQASSVFGFKRETVCIVLREFFNEFVLPEALADLDEEHIMRFTGSAQELFKLDQAAAELYANDFIKQRFLNGQTISMDEVDKAKAKMISQYRKNGMNRFVKIKKALYRQPEYEFDYIIDNEQADVQALATNLKSIVGDLATNPNILNDPRLKLLYFKFAETLGVNPAELELADEQAQDILSQNAQGAPPNSPNGGGAPPVGALPNNPNQNGRQQINSPIQNGASPVPVGGQ